MNDAWIEEIPTGCATRPVKYKFVTRSVLYPGIAIIFAEFLG